MSRLARLTLTFLAASGALFLLVRRWRGSIVAVEVAGDSMAPALQAGDWVLVHRSSLPPGQHAAGLIAYLRGPDERPLLKRVIGVPGESLRVGGGVQVNGRPLLEPYAHGVAPAEQHRGVRALEADEYFVLGDNRAASTDSRDFGPVRRERIEGVVWLRYWPPERIGRIPRGRRTLAAPQDDQYHTRSREL
jgi:signal peptidase I